MMWTVVWRPSAEQDLASVWLAAKDRAAVTRASDEIETVLRQVPELVGEVRFDTVRRVVVSPLGVEFEVIDQDRMVWVLAAWDASKSSND